MLCEVQETQEAGWSVLAVVGELDLASAPRVRAAVVRALGGAGAAPRVVLDLGAVDFIDSSGLGVLLGALRRVRQAGGDLRVVVAEPQVRQVFALTELDRVLALFATRREALAATADGQAGVLDG